MVKALQQRPIGRLRRGMDKISPLKNWTQSLRRSLALSIFGSFAFVDCATKRSHAITSRVARLQNSNTSSNFVTRKDLQSLKSLQTDFRRTLSTSLSSNQKTNQSPEGFPRKPSSNDHSAANPQPRNSLRQAIEEARCQLSTQTQVQTSLHPLLNWANKSLSSKDSQVSAL